MVVLGNGEFKEVHAIEIGYGYGRKGLCHRDPLVCAQSKVIKDSVESEILISRADLLVIF